MDYFPQGLAQIFPFLKLVTIDNCGLKAITRDDLIGLENLEAIIVTNCQLHFLPSNLFVGFTKLKWVDFSNNKIECLDSKMLKMLETNQLEHVSFLKNPKISSFFDQATSGSISVDDLIKIIDKNCGKPDETEFSDEALKKQEFCDRFVAGFRELWASKRYSDFVITAIGKGKSREMKVHKNILGTQSSVFAAIFENDMKEKKDGIMHIEDFCAETVRDFLHFLYTGEIEADNAMDLFAIATKYEVKLLRERTEKIIMRNIFQTNAIDVLCLGHLHLSEKMKVAAFSEIKQMFPMKDLEDSLLDDPLTLKKMIHAVKKIQEGQSEIDDLLHEY